MAGERSIDQRSLATGSRSVALRRARSRIKPRPPPSAASASLLGCQWPHRLASAEVKEGRSMPRAHFPARLFGVVVAVALALPGAARGWSAPAPSGAAADGPGALSHFDLARKDCLGT